MLDNVEFHAVDPEGLRACGRALNEAWQTVNARQTHDPTPAQQSTRHILARSIVRLAATGERDVDELKRYALRDLSVRLWRATPHRYRIGE